MRTDTAVPIPLRPDTDDPGLMSRCAALAVLARALGRPAAPTTIAALGGAAFRAYFFSPDDNHGWRNDHPHVRWRARSLSVDNYGLVEALAAHTGLHARPWPRPSTADVLSLVRHEQAAGRTIALRTNATPERWVQVDSLAIAADGATLHLKPTAGDDGPLPPPIHLALRSPEALHAPADAVAELMTCRPLGEPARPSLASTLRRDVLQWAASHHHAPHELVHDEEAFYATGAAAWQRMAELAREAEDDGAAIAFLRAAAAEYARARRAAATWLLEQPEDDAAAAAEAATEVSALLEALGPALDARDDRTRDALLSATTAADRRLAEALARLLQADHGP